MKLWLSHKVSGEDRNQLEKEMRGICIKLEEIGISYYCSFLDVEMRSEKSKKELIENAFGKIGEFDGVLAIVKSEDKSEGMLIEIGYAIAKNKKFILAIKKGIMEERYVRALANQIIEFDNPDDLLNKLEEIKQ